MPSYEFAIRIQPISGDQFLHGGYVRNGGRPEDIPLKTCHYLNFSDHPDFANVDRDLRDLIRPDAGNVVSPWSLHPHAQPHVRDYHGLWTNIDEVEHRFAEMAEPSRRVRLEVSRRNDNTQILDWYGQWLYDALLLGGPDRDDRNHIFTLFDSCRNAAIGRGAVFRILLEISLPAGEAEIDDAQLQKRRLRLHQLSSLTYELLRRPGQPILTHAGSTMYRVNDVDSFRDDDTATARCKAPRAFIGVAGPDDQYTGLPTLSLFEWFSQLEEITPREDRQHLGRLNGDDRFILSGTLDMRLSKTIFGGADGPGRRELVAIIAHGVQPTQGGQRRLILNSGHANQPTSPAEVGIGAVGEFLTACESRFAIIACCQGRNPGVADFDDLGAQLFDASTPSLAAIVCFRSEVAVRTVAAFMKGIAERLKEAGPDDPFQLMQALAYAQHAITVSADQFDAANRQWDYAIPAVYVRQELEIHVPRPPEERWVNIGMDDGVVREIAMYPVTREEYRAFLAVQTGNQADPWSAASNRNDDDLPATGLTWETIQDFMDWKNTDSNNGGWKYYLPFVTDWIEAIQSSCGLPKANTTGSLVSVFETSPNDRDVFGMLGNCWEIAATTSLPQKPFQLRGGDCRSNPDECNEHHCLTTSIDDINAHAAVTEDQTGLEIGFRLARKKVKQLE